MSYKRLSYALIAITAILMMTGLLLGRNPLRPDNGPSSDAKADIDDYARRTEALAHAKDFEGLKRLAVEMESKAETVSDAAFADMMLKVSAAFDSYDFNDDRQHALARKYAKLALERGGKLPVETEVALAMHLQGRAEYLTGQAKAEAWPQDRSERMTYWFHAWQRLSSEIVRDFDFSKRPTQNVPAPSGTGLPAGVSPTAIKDIVLRAEYEAAIEANRQKIAAFNKQWLLHNLEKDFSKYAENFVIEAYSTAPFAWAELKQYVDAYVSDKDAGNRILTGVSVKMASP
jgi:hypothetical protein